MTIKPTYSVITDSDKNPVEDRTIEALKTAGGEVFCTKDGDVSVSGSGTEISVIQ